MNEPETGGKTMFSVSNILIEDGHFHILSTRSRKAARKFLLFVLVYRLLQTLKVLSKVGLNPISARA